MSEQAYDPQALTAALRRLVARGTSRWDVVQVTIKALLDDPEFSRMLLPLLPDAEREDLRRAIHDASEARNTLVQRLALTLNDVSLWPRIELWAQEHNPELCTAWQRFQLEHQQERIVPNERNVEAIAELLRGCRGYVQITSGADRIEATVESLARDLAAGGLLVPEVLTREQAGDLLMRTVGPEQAHQDDKTLLIRDLERIAKGERG